MTTMVAYLALALRLAGCSTSCQAGMLSNIEAESGPAMNPCIVSASGIGWIQWAGVRRRRIMRELGAAWCRPSAQIAYIIRELAEMKLRDRLFAMTDPAEAARFVMLAYERPRSRDPRHRMARAREIYRDLLLTGAAP